MNEYVNVQPQKQQKPPPPFKESEEDKFLYKLIDVVREYPILYDGTKFNPTIFETNWQNVAKTLGNGGKLLNNLINAHILSISKP